MEMLNQLPKTVGEIESEYAAQGMQSLPFRDHALDMITKDSERSASLMQNWMKEK